VWVDYVCGVYFEWGGERTSGECGFPADFCGAEDCACGIGEIDEDDLIFGQSPDFRALRVGANFLRLQDSR